MRARGQVDVAAGEAILSVENVSLAFGGVKALSDVSFDIRKGEIRAIIGPNGAGKTSMLNVINGFYQPQQGRIAFKGKLRAKMRPYEAARGGIARTFQNVALFRGMTALDNIMAGRSLAMHSNFFWQLLRYGPALNYNAGPGNSTDSNFVHDLLCPTVNASGACTSGAGAVAPVTPMVDNTPGATLQDKLNYLQAHPSAQYTETGPFSGVAGVFLQFTKEAGLHYDVSLVSVSSATLSGFLNNTGSEAGMLPLIANAKWNQVVMADQRFRPLPTTVTVNDLQPNAQIDASSFAIPSKSEN